MKKRQARRRRRIKGIKISSQRRKKLVILSRGSIICAYGDIKEFY
jgi:hypothetical protein